MLPTLVMAAINACCSQLTSKRPQHRGPRGWLRLPLGKHPCTRSASRGHPRAKVGVPQSPGLPDGVYSQGVDVRALRRLPRPGSKGGMNITISVPKKPHLLLVRPCFPTSQPRGQVSKGMVRRQLQPSAFA